jgi:hypothetical protein
MSDRASCSIGKVFQSAVEDGSGGKKKPAILKLCTQIQPFEVAKNVLPDEI